MRRATVIRNRRRLGPLQLVRSYQALRRARATGDPRIVLKFMRPFHTREFERTFFRTLADPVGRRLLDEERSLLPVLADLESLQALSEGSLGREYARFMEAEELSVTDFAQASLASMSELDYQDRRAWTLAQRLRDMHDLIHVVSGYGRDLLGEMAVLSFSSAGRKLGGNYRLVFILRLAQWRFARAGRPDAAGVLRAATERGARAAFLPAVEWERLLPLPLSLVREGLGISPPPAYEPIRYDLWCTLEQPSIAAQQGAAAVDRPVHSFGSRWRLATSSPEKSGLVNPGARN